MGQGHAILDWVEKQHDWVQDALRRHAQAPGFVLSATDRDAVIARVRQAAGIVQPTALSHDNLKAEHLKFGTSTEPRSLLCSLGPVQNLGRLAAEQQLRFATNGITLIYGDNGTGKSGYCRITKKVCRSLTSEDLLGDVFAAGDKPPAKALIRYIPHGSTEPVSVEWTDGETPPDAVRNISVFDSRNARFYIDRENRIGFLPPEIFLLERHGVHRGEMSAIFEGERKAFEMNCRTALPGGYTPNGKVASLLARLVLKSPNLPSAEELSQLGDWNEDDKAELQRLEQALASDPAAIAARCVRAAEAIASYALALGDIEAGLSDAVQAEIATLAGSAITTAQAVTIAAESAFSGEPLSGVGQGPWRLMYEHAAAYVASIGMGDELPSAGDDVCALCQQPLGAEGAERMARFQEFVAGQAAKAAASAAAALAAKIAALDAIAIPSGVTVDQALAEYRSISSERAELGAEVSAYFLVAATRRDALKAAALTGHFELVPALPAPLSERVALDIEALGKEIEALQDAAKLDQRREGEVTRLGELKDKEKLHNALETVLARQADLAGHAKVLECTKLVGTQQLSSHITAVRRSMVTDGLETRITAEIAGLDLGHIPFTVTDLSRDGNSFFGVNLDAAVSVPNERVLSEGEQRALALACYLAEVGADEANHGLVIDDPVSSLDHLRIRRVAERLVLEAAKGKQVIVFTHNLLFYNDILHAAASAPTPVPVARRMVSKKQASGFGLISEVDEPWATQKVTVRIAGLRDRAKKAEAVTDIDNEEFRRAAKDFYSDLRETWERLVEELLLNKVVERYSSDVRTQSLREVSVTDEDYKTIFWAMKRVSEFSGHDKPAGKQNPIPSPADMKSDVEKIDAFRQLVVERKSDTSKMRKAFEEPPKADVF